MKMQVNPAVIVVILILVVGVVGYLFYKGTATPDPVPMSPQGPAAKLLKAGAGGGRRMSPDVLEAQKMQQGQAAQPGK